MFKKIKNFLKRLSGIERNEIEKSLLLQGKLLEIEHNKLKELKDLGAIEFSVFSQWGEDGILAWLVAQLDKIPHSFIEFGVANYQESNTRYLLQSQNWQGLVLDGSAENIAQIIEKEYFWRHQLIAKAAFIDCNNINKLISDNGFNNSVGILSIDVDGNDYWIWEAIDVINPVILVCEYNAVFGDLHALTIPYKPDFDRARIHHSCLYFGASIQALINLGKEKNYTFVGSNSTGCNAFFVKDEFADKILSKLDQIVSYPSLIREGRDEDGKIIFTPGSERAKLIGHLPLINLTSGSTVKLNDLDQIYSEEWS